MIVPTYISSNTFTVEGNHVEDLPKGRPILVYTTEGDPPETVKTRTTISAAIYRSVPDNTLVSVTDLVIDATITEIRLSPVYRDSDSQNSNETEHGHTASWDGGEKAFGGFTNVQNVIDLNQLIDAVQAGTPLYFLRKNAAGTGVELVALSMSMFADFAINSPVNGQVLKYDSGTEKWINGEDATGGGSGGGGTGSWAAYYMGL
jgi:hypothetical protein